MYEIIKAYDTKITHKARHFTTYNVNTPPKEATQCIKLQIMGTRENLKQKNCYHGHLTPCSPSYNLTLQTPEHEEPAAADEENDEENN